MAAGLVTEAYPLDLLFQNSQIEDEPEVGAIYRGGPLFRPQVRSSSPHSLRSASTSSSSSSSSSSFFAGRLGAIAAVVELAISRWARGRTSSSSDSSSSSSQSSITTQSRSRVSRRRRRRSGSSHLHSIQSERDIRARIKAREESRQISREFTLYIPPGLVSAQPPPHGNEEAALSGVSRTTSLPSVLAKLEAALRRSTKARRAYDRSRNPKLLSVPLHDPMAHHHYMLPDSISWPDVTTSRKGRKGKERDNGAVTEPVTMAPSPSETAGAIVNHKAWWLDVARPTWADMSAIGKVTSDEPLSVFHHLADMLLATAATTPSVDVRGYLTARPSREIGAFPKAGVLLPRIPGH
jgi:magnesium transporter